MFYLHGVIFAPATGGVAGKLLQKVNSLFIPSAKSLNYQRVEMDPLLSACVGMDSYFVRFSLLDSDAGGLSDLELALSGYLYQYKANYFSIASFS